MKPVHKYYSPKNLYEKIIDGLKQCGKNSHELTVDDLQVVDEFHIRGDTATKELIRMSQFDSKMHILDLGCGIGGSARRLAHELGCRVTGVDLSDEFIDTATRLTYLLKMDNRVRFKAANALQLPYEDNTFDGAWSIQMSMNMHDKPGWLKEIYRVLKPGSRLVLYEVCGTTKETLYFPVPWAKDSSMSFLATMDSFRNMVLSTGFEIEVWNDKTSLAQKAFGNAQKPTGKEELPPVGVHLLVGDDILHKAYNLRCNLEQGSVALLEALVVK